MSRTSPKAQRPGPLHRRDEDSRRAPSCCPVRHSSRVRACMHAWVCMASGVVRAYVRDPHVHAGGRLLYVFHSSTQPLLLCGACCVRRALASDKRRGEVKEYLEEIAGDESRGLERWFYDDWLKRVCLWCVAGAVLGPLDCKTSAGACAADVSVSQVLHLTTPYSGVLGGGGGGAHGSGFGLPLGPVVSPGGTQLVVL